MGWRTSAPDFNSSSTVRLEPLEGGASTKVIYNAHFPNGLPHHRSAADTTPEMERCLAEFARLFNGGPAGIGASGASQSPDDDKSPSAAALAADVAPEDAQENTQEDALDEGVNTKGVDTNDSDAKDFDLSGNADTGGEADLATAAIAGPAEALQHTLATAV